LVLDDDFGYVKVVENLLLMHEFHC